MGLPATLLAGNFYRVFFAEPSSLCRVAFPSVDEASAAPVSPLLLQSFLGETHTQKTNRQVEKRFRKPAMGTGLR